MDEIQDLELFESVYQALNVGARPLFFEELKAFLQEHPEVAEHNRGIQVKWRDDTELVKELNAATTLNKKL